MHKNIEHSKTAMGVSFAGQCAMYSIWSPLEASNITSKHKSRAASNAAALHILSPSLCDCITLTGGIKCKKTANEGRRLLCGQKKKNSQVSEGLRRLRWVKLVWHFQISDFEDGHQPVCGGPKNSNNHAISVRPSHQMLNLQYSSYKCLVFC